jgi:hypothetical protein
VCEGGLFSVGRHPKQCQLCDVSYDAHCSVSYSLSCPVHPSLLSPHLFIPNITHPPAQVVTPSRTYNLAVMDHLTPAQWKRSIEKLVARSSKLTDKGRKLMGGRV